MNKPIAYLHKAIFDGKSDKLVLNPICFVLFLKLLEFYGGHSVQVGDRGHGSMNSFD